MIIIQIIGHYLFNKVAVSHYIPILYCDTLMGINFNPNYYVDITDHYY